MASLPHTLPPSIPVSRLKSSLWSLSDLGLIYSILASSALASCFALPPPYMESCFVLDNCSCVVLPSRVPALVPPPSDVQGCTNAARAGCPGAAMQSCGKALLARFSAHSRYTNDCLESNDQKICLKIPFPRYNRLNPTGSSVDLRGTWCGSWGGSRLRPGDATITSEPP